MKTISTDKSRFNLNRATQENFQKHKKSEKNIFKVILLTLLVLSALLLAAESFGKSTGTINDQTILNTDTNYSVVDRQVMMKYKEFSINDFYRKEKQTNNSRLPFLKIKTDELKKGRKVKPGKTINKTNYH